MLDKKSYVDFIKRIQGLEDVETGLEKEFGKLMFDVPNICLDECKQLAFDILESAMGDLDRDTTEFIYETNYGKNIEEWRLRECGLYDIKSFEELYDLITFKRNSRKIFVIADTHFNHKNIIKYCNRPYNSVEEMNKDIIRKWNSVVRPNDIVFHLGDFGFGTQMELGSIFKQLNGRKYLIMGNHDYKAGKKYYEEIGFDRVYKEYTLGNMVLSHYPKEITEGQINIYGHIHDAEPKDWYDDDFHVCVSVEKINYIPKKLNDLLKEVIYE